MNGIDLPRGRTTDALVAFAFFTAVLMLVPSLAAAVLPYGFVPAVFVGGGWQDPLYWLSPLVSQFLVASIAGTLFNTVFLLIAGRFVERSIGPFGLLAIFVVGAYAGAAARTALTPGSMIVTAGAESGLFAVAGAYFMLYGVSRALPVPRHYGRVGQIAALAAIWIVVTLVFMLASRSFELSVSFIDPLGGLIAGIALARPLLRWRYRHA